MSTKNRIYRLILDSDVDTKLKSFTEKLEEGEKIVATSVDSGILIISTVVEVKKPILRG